MDRCRVCGLLLPEQADEPSTSRGANSERCCAVCDHDAALFMLRIMACCAVVQPIDRSPVTQGSQDGKLIASIVRVNEEMCKIRRKGIYIGYERQTVGEILTSVTNYVSLWQQYENKVPAVKGVEIKSSNLVQTTNFLPFDIYLNIEFLKTNECFRLLGLEDQVKQIHRTALAITLFNEAYVSRCDGYQKLVLPGGMVPLAIEYPENVPNKNLSTELLGAHISVLGNFITPLLLMSPLLSSEEYVLLKLLMVTYTQDIEGLPSLSEDGCTVLKAHFLRFYLLLKSHMVTRYGDTEANRRWIVMNVIVGHYFDLAKKTKVLHGLVKLVHNIAKFPCEFFDQLMQL